MKLVCHLAFDGRCAEAFALYADALDGRIVSSVTFGEMGHSDVAPGFADKIMNVQLAADGADLMGCDAPPQHFHKPSGISVAIMIDDDERAHRIFDKLSAGGVVTMALAPTPWARLFGMWTDRFGIDWMLNSALLSRPDLV